MDDSDELNEIKESGGDIDSLLSADVEEVAAEDEPIEEENEELVVDPLIVKGPVLDEEIDPQEEADEEDDDEEDDEIYNESFEDVDNF
jgi:hypothetical protein